MLRHRYWHFVDVPFSPDGATLPDIPVPNAETQIDVFRAVLASDQTDELKSYDLTWLLHLIGDVHQPLHATTRITQIDLQGDAGGNKVKLSGDADFNLHAYWDDVPGVSDSQFCAKKVHCVERAGVIGNAISNMPLWRSMLNAAPASGAQDLKTSVWVQESFQAAQTSVYQAPLARQRDRTRLCPGLIMRQGRYGWRRYAWQKREQD